MPKLLMFEDENGTGGTWIRQLEDQSARMGVGFQQANAEVLETALSSPEGDVVIVDVSVMNASRVEFLTAARRQHPEMRALVVVDSEMTHSDALQSLLDSSSIDFVRTPVDVREVLQRVRRLAGSSEATGPGDPGPRRSPGRSESRALRSERRSKPVGPPPGGLTGHLVPSLRSANGRLDARKVAAVFGLSLADVARIIERQLSTVHKTSDASSLQQPLGVFERIAALLIPLAGSAEGMRMWLNAPNADLEDYPPVALLKRGQGQIVAELLEDALVGQPG